MADDIVLIADTAIMALGAEAERLEQIAFTMPNAGERAKLVEVVEGLRDLEATLRLRVRVLARRRPTKKPSA